MALREKKQCLPFATRDVAGFMRDRVMNARREETDLFYGFGDFGTVRGDGFPAWRSVRNFRISSIDCFI